MPSGCYLPSLALGFLGSRLMQSHEGVVFSVSLNQFVIFTKLLKSLIETLKNSDLSEKV